MYIYIFVICTIMLYAVYTKYYIQHNPSIVNMYKNKKILCIS